MNQPLFKIGSVYRNARGRVVKIEERHDFRVNAMRVASIAVDSPDDMPQTFHTDLSTGRCEVGNKNYDLIPGELQCVNGEWLPITEQPMSVYFADAQEDKPAEAADKSPIERLRDLVAIQGSDGNWNCDEYMLGMFNGMELALAIMEDRDPVYRTLPKPAVVALPAAPTAHKAISGLTCLVDRDHRFGLFRF